MKIDEKKIKPEAIIEIFKSKTDFHKLNGKEPIEKKFEKFLKLQKITFEILKSTGRSLPPGKRVWKI